MRKYARASAILWISPPLSFAPFSPTKVLYPFGRSKINSWMCAILAALTTSSNVARTFAICKFSRIDFENR